MTRCVNLREKEQVLMDVLEDCTVDSHQAIAEKLGVSPATARNWVNECSNDVLIRLANNKKANKRNHFQHLADKIREHKKRGLSDTKAYGLEGITRYTFNRFIRDLL